MLLEEIENRFPNATWGGGFKPSKYNPLIFTNKKKYVGIVMSNPLSYFIDRSKAVCEANLRTHMKGYEVITFDDFMNGNMQEIQNEMDISFLYG